MSGYYCCARPDWADNLAEGGDCACRACGKTMEQAEAELAAQREAWSQELSDRDLEVP